MPEWWHKFLGSPYGAAFVVLTLIVAAIEFAQVAAGVAALGIPAYWWGVAFSVVGAVMALAVFREFDQRLRKAGKRRVRDRGLLAQRNRQIATLQDENARLIRDNRDLTTRWALGISQVVPISVVGEPISNVAESVGAAPLGTTEEPTENAPVSDQGSGGSGVEGST